MRGDMRGNPSFREVVERVKKKCIGAYANQDVPFDKLVEYLQPKRRLTHTPFFKVFFEYSNSSVQEFNMASLKINVLDIHKGEVRHDLKLGVSEGPEHLICFFEFRTDLFNILTIENMIVMLNMILHHAVSFPNANLSEIILALDKLDHEFSSQEKKAIKEIERKKLKNLKKIIKIH
jgi:non-ribosomal peptide synthetase component F